MKARYALLAAAGAVLVTATAVVRSAGPDAITGVWTVEPATWKSAPARSPLVQLTLSRRHGRNGDSNHSNSVALSELKGLTAEQMSAGAAGVSFALERDAGRFAFEGSFRGGEGAGHFTFTPRPEFVAAMRDLGYAALDDEKIYSMAVLDVSRDFVKQLDALGYSRLALDDLFSLRIHGASPEFVREMQSLGYRLSADELVSLRIHGASPEFVREMQSLASARLSAEDLVSLRIHGATPEFVRALRTLGYERVPAEDLVSMRIHGVSAEFIKELKALGYDHVAVDDLVSMRIHGVSPEFVRRVQARRGSVTVDRLVEMRIHGQDQ